MCSADWLSSTSGTWFLFRNQEINNCNCDSFWSQWFTYISVVAVHVSVKSWKWLKYQMFCLITMSNSAKPQFYNTDIISTYFNIEVKGITSPLTQRTMTTDLFLKPNLMIYNFLNLSTSSIFIYSNSLGGIVLSTNYYHILQYLN